MEFYWELIQHDGTRLELPPSAVESVKRHMDSGRPIHTARSGSIPVNQIKAFRPTDRPFVDNSRLLDASAQAFHEPVITEEDSVVTRWVKKHVTQSKWETHYSKIPAYQKLRDDGGMVVAAFRLPVHEININNVSYCDELEIKLLQSKQ